MPQGLGSRGTHSPHVFWTSFWRCHSLSSSSARPLSCASMETSPSPPSTTFVPSPPNTTSMVKQPLGENVGFLVAETCVPECSTQCGRCVPVWYEPTDADKACKPFLSDAWKSLTYCSPNLVELCTMTRTLGIPTPDGKFVPQWLCLILELKCFIKEFKVVGKCVKVIESFGPTSTAELPHGGAECCFDPLTPPAGTYPLSDCDPGSQRGFGVWRARGRFCWPAAEKTTEGTSRGHLIACS